MLAQLCFSNSCVILLFCPPEGPFFGKKNGPDLHSKLQNCHTFGTVFVSKPQMALWDINITCHISIAMLPSFLYCIISYAISREIGFLIMYKLFVMQFDKNQSYVSKCQLKLYSMNWRSYHVLGSTLPLFYGQFNWCKKWGSVNFCPTCLPKQQTAMLGQPAV